MRPNSPRTRSRCPFCRLDVIVTLPVLLTGGMTLGEAAWAEAMVRRLWKKGKTGESRESQVITPPLGGWRSLLSQLLQQHGLSRAASRLLTTFHHLMVKEMQDLPGSQCLHSSCRTPQKAQSPGKNVALDGHSCICPLFLSEHFPIVC